MFKRVVHLSPLDPEAPLNSDFLKLSLSRIFQENNIKPKEIVESCGYQFRVKEIKDVKTISPINSPEIRFIHSFDRFRDYNITLS
ncbi:MAG: hypothetical protein ACTSWN_02665 [Promethearchaeota archaeon]